MTRPPPPSLGVSSAKQLSVFDFTVDDERVEKISEKILRKFAKPKRKRDLPFSPITKYKFLECCKFYFCVVFFFFEFQSLKKNCVFGLLDGLVSAGKWVLNFDLLVMRNCGKRFSLHALEGAHCTR